MTVKAEASPQSFSSRLRALSADVHREAESTRYIEDLLAGRLPVERYGDLLVQLWFVYRPLEEAAEAMAADAVAGRFVFDDLARVPALEADLACLAGSGWEQQVVPLPATQRYRKRLAEVGFDDPARFVAHHYTRYMGDLSGGQVIGETARRVYGFGDAGGAEFYRFPDSLDIPAVKVRYRELLDEAGADATFAEAMADEVLVAYGLNTDLLVELATGRSLVED